MTTRGITCFWVKWCWRLTRCPWQLPSFKTLSNASKQKVVTLLTAPRSPSPNEYGNVVVSPAAPAKTHHVPGGAQALGLSAWGIVSSCVIVQNLWQLLSGGPANDPNSPRAAPYLLRGTDAALHGWPPLLPTPHPQTVCRLAARTLLFVASASTALRSISEALAPTAGQPIT